MPEKSQVRAIIPCAGFGTRMNMDPSMSKELLIDPVTNQPLIQWSLDLCSERNMKLLVIIRSEKTDLIEYIVKNTKADLLVLDNIQGEWPNTILRSKDLWFDNNILILPDTRFKPTYKIRNIKRQLKRGRDIVFAIHKVDDVSKWGAVCNINHLYCEKPIETTTGYAWGLIGFKKEIGEELFENMIINKGQVIWSRGKNVDYTYLKSFTDLTRTGKIEAY